MSFRWLGVPFLLKTYKDFGSDKVNELHARSLIGLGDKLHYFALISVSGAIFIGDVGKQRILAGSAFLAFFLGVLLKNYAFHLVQQLEAKERRKDRFGKRQSLNHA